MDPNDPDLHALIITIGFASDLTNRQAPTSEWNTLETELLAAHTPEQLARMLVGAAAIIARTRG